MKRKNRFVLLFISLFIAITVFAQSIENTDLTGNWVCYKKTLKNGKTGENVTLNKKPFVPNMTLEFLENNTLKITEGTYTTEINYLLNDDRISFGNRKYLIEKATKSELILLEIKETFSDDFLYRRYFKKKD